MLRTLYGCQRRSLSQRDRVHKTVRSSGLPVTAAPCSTARDRAWGNNPTSGIILTDTRNSVVTGPVTSGNHVWRQKEA